MAGKPHPFVNIGNHRSSHSGIFQGVQLCGSWIDSSEVQNMGGSCREPTLMSQSLHQPVTPAQADLTPLFPQVLQLGTRADPHTTHTH